MSTPSEENVINPEFPQIPEVPAEFEDEDPDSLVGEPVEDDGMPEDDTEDDEA